MVLRKLMSFGLISMLAAAASSVAAMLDRALMFAIDALASPGKNFELHYQPGLADVALAGTAPAYRHIEGPERTYHQRSAARHT